MNSEISLPDLLDTANCVNSLFNIRLNCATTTIKYILQQEAYQLAQGQAKRVVSLKWKIAADIPHDTDGDLESNRGRVDKDLQDKDYHFVS